MGQSKQLLLIDGKPLLQRTVETALSANTGKVVVVLGANEDVHKKVIENLPAQMILNKHWNRGMGSSIKVGINYILKNLPESHGVIISVCDQPYLTDKHFIVLTRRFRNSEKLIVASSYNVTDVGVPILFGRSLFNDLVEIGDSEGAKGIMKKYMNQILQVPFPQGAIDLDTLEDYNTFIQ